MKKPLAPVDPARVRIDDPFWAPRLDVNRSVTIPWIQQRCVETGRLDALRLAWKPELPNPPGPLWEADLSQWLEAACYSLAVHPDLALTGAVNEVIELFKAAQRADGYLNVFVTLTAPDQRWSNLRDQHELTCAGHLIEAAVAHFQATGHRTLLDVVCRYADYIGSIFGDDPGKRRGYPGRAGIESALIRLYRATHEHRYLALARFFIDERGRSPHWFLQEAAARGDDPNEPGAANLEHTQSHVPVREQTRAVGHALGALHLYAAMTDLAQESGDDALVTATLRLWDSIYLRQTYLNGSIASRVDEGLAVEYELPNETTGADTSAAIASMDWNHRLLHWNCEARFGDELERALYNTVLGAVSSDGQQFFQSNPLAIHPDRVTAKDPTVSLERTAGSGLGCSPNLARLLASLGRFIYSESESEVAVHLFVQSRVRLTLAGGNVMLRQETDYPWEGHVRLVVERLESPLTFALRVRLPGWCRDPQILVNGEPSNSRTRDGYAAVHREWRAGDVVELMLPMPVERVRAHPAVRENQGCVALQRGPLVYCVESVENGPLDHLALLRNAAVEARFEPALFDGSKIIYTNAVTPTEETWNGRLYRTQPEGFRETPLRAIPYFCRASRGPCEMRVWIRETADEAVSS